MPVEDDCLKSPTTKVTFVKTCIIVRPHRSQSNKTGARNKIDRRGHYLKQVVGSQARVGAPRTDRAAMPTSGSITTAEESRPTARRTRTFFKQKHADSPVCRGRETPTRFEFEASTACSLAMRQSRALRESFPEL